MAGPRALRPDPHPPDVTGTDYAFVARRWRSPLWRGFDWLLLTLVLAHGLNGMWRVVDDYVRIGPGRRAMRLVSLGLALVLFGTGTLTILRFPR